LAVPPFAIRPLGGPRGFIGPIGVSNGSFGPNDAVCVSARSRLAANSVPVAAATASSTSAALMPRSSGRRCFQSKRSGKYGAARYRAPQDH
jgi:hypothetical protein